MQPDIIIRWSDVLCSKYDGGHRIYVMYDDNDTCLYVGQAKDAGDRLINHVGLGTFSVSSTGQWVIDPRPQSHNWQIALYVPTLPRDTRPFDSTRQDMHVDDIEGRFIYEMSPVFNAQERKCNPSKVRAFWQHSAIANEGMA